MTIQNKKFIFFKCGAALLFALSCSVICYAKTDFSNIVIENAKPIRLERTKKSENNAR